MDEVKIVIGGIAVFLGIVAYLPYIRDTLTRKTKPHVYTWFVASLVTAIIFALQVSDGAGPGAWVTAAVAFAGLLIFLASLKHGYKKVTYLDTFFLLAALVAIGLWLIAKEPLISTILLVLTGLFSQVPTIRKSWHQPHSETLSTYVINTLRHVLSFGALAHYSLITGLNPFAWVVMNGGFAVMLIVRRRQLSTD